MRKLPILPPDDLNPDDLDICLQCDRVVVPRVVRAEEQRGRPSRIALRMDCTASGFASARQSISLKFWPFHRIVSESFMPQALDQKPRAVLRTRGLIEPLEMSHPADSPFPMSSVPVAIIGNRK